MAGNKFKVVKEKKACELLGCKRTKFHVTYKPKLTIYKSDNGHHTFYSLTQIQKIIENENKKMKIIGEDGSVLSEGKFEIVE